MIEPLWAPWRAAYIESSAKPSAAVGPCFFCKGLEDTSDRENLLVLRRGRSAVFLNRFPYNNGHLLICPIAHRGTLEEQSSADLNESLETIRMAIRAIDRLMKPHGYNVGLNLGRAAGAGVPGHLHWHIVPRWDGDTNFMPVLANAKVIVESLHDFYDRISRELRTEESARADPS